MSKRHRARGRVPYSHRNYFTYTYDGAKNLIEVTDQDSNHYSWDYDGAGRVKYSVDALGQRYDYSWDRSHNLTAITEGEGSNVSYVYGKTNRLASLTAPTGTINYRYDESGRVYQGAGEENYYNAPACQDTILELLR